MLPLAHSNLILRPRQPGYTGHLTFGRDKLAASLLLAVSRPPKTPERNGHARNQSEGERPALGSIE